jgi:hypothetical protein
MGTHELVLLARSIALALRALMILGGIAAVALNLLWLGVPPGLEIRWVHTPAAAIGVTLWLAGLFGLGAPLVRRYTFTISNEIVWWGFAIGIAAELTCLVVIEPYERPWLVAFSEDPLNLVVLTSWASMAGGVCWVLTALFPSKRHRDVSSNSALNPDTPLAPY